ncbi:MAG: RecJ [uncultured Solirubrobacterales bacterium]|uniref:RecJ n=1 Tax=uncultured Solirubrobacterales bacterium TaxID=768556 RepID=A0A6J4RQ37_9ACTN|nr:MAG: RecJ [uncultured Solirubrobacterales bacterium]
MVGTELEQVADELRSADKLLLTTHENPDGDALGSLLGLHLLLRQLGKDAAMFLAADEFPLPHEYRHLPIDGVLNAPPTDLAERLVVFLDCGNIDRMPVDFLRADGIRIVNVDHHHDNTRFGEVNVVDPSASCTAELVWRLVHELGAELTPPMAEALYIGLVTDTGRFMYRNTGPEAHRMAAELIEAGASPHAVNRQVFESLPFRRIELLARGLQRVQRFDDGAITTTYLSRDDFVETGADETDSEGIVDHLRSVEGTAVAVLVRDLLAEDRAGLRKVSLRAVDGEVDVSRIARGLGGGGHTQAAGFTTALETPELLERVRAEVGEQRG